MKNISILNLFLFLLLSILIGCDDFDDYSTNPNHRLRFSVDTLSFDTIFSSVGSTTKQFVVYNPNDEALQIESIQLANAGKSGFRMNVDGRKGDLFKNVNIWKNDSLFVMVEVTVNPNGTNQPLVIEDSILFYTNGIRQSILLQAYGQDVHLIKGGVTYSADMTFTADLPYLVYDSILVAEGATLTIEKGATLYMHNKARLLIDGTLKAIGTQDEPIVIRGDRLDYIQADVPLPYDRTPGLWGGIYFAKSSFDNEFDYVSVRNGSSGLTFWESDTEKLKMRLSNSQIINMDSNLLMAINCHIEAVNTEIANSAGSVVTLVGGKYEFIHCTIENEGIVGKNRNPSMSTLMLCNKIEKNKKELFYPLTQAYFENSIIAGSYKKELAFFVKNDSEEKGDDATFNYRFNSCYIRTDSVTDNDRFVNDLYTNRPVYLKRGKKEEFYEYDFRLKNGSEGIGKADRKVAEKYPVDRYGVNRLTSETGPSIGAYEYVYQEEEDDKE